jgi:iron complex transport system substrate-binding protein
MLHGVFSRNIIVNYFSLLALITLLFITIIACRDSGNSTKTLTQLDSSYSVSFTDEMGMKTFIEEPEKIVSFSPEITEIIYALGTGDKMIAANESSDYPFETDALPKLGFMSINAESIIQYEPNLIILTAGFEDVAQKLDDLGYQVVFLDAPKSIDGLYENINILGRILKQKSASDNLIARLQSQVQEAVSKVSQLESIDKRSVFLEIDPALYTVSDDSLIGHLLGLANVKNIAGSVKGSYPQLTLEFIVDSNPDIILLADIDSGGSVENTLARNGWKNINALKNKQVFALEADWISRAGPRFILGLQQIISLVYGFEFIN